MDPRSILRKVFGLDARDRRRTPQPHQPPGGWPSDFTARPHRRGALRAWRWTAWGVLGLFALAGFLGVVVRPILAATRDPAPEAPAAAINDGEARALAAAYAADYFSYDSLTPGVRTAALTRWTGQAANSTANWSGTGQLRADVVLPGDVAVRDTSAVVAVTVRVTAALLPEGTDLPPAPDTPDGPVAADPGPAASPWVPADPVWLTLHVPLLLDDGALRVADDGGSLVTGSPTTVVRDDPATDGSLASDTADLPDTVFGALADGTTGYLTAPGYDLPGLDGLVTLAGVSGWTVADGDGTRWATADVTWTLAGTDLTITQPYALTITDDQGRWLVAALDTPTQETAP